MITTPITSRIAQPSPKDVRVARKRAGLTQTEAAMLVSVAQNQPYRTWQNYEVETGKPGHREIPLATWELFLLMTGQHETLKLNRKKIE